MTNFSLHHVIRQPKIKIENPPLLLLLHGYGSNEMDLFSFADELPQEFLIVSARAPLTLGTGSYAWYTIHFDTVDGKFSDIPEAIKARTTIANFIDELIKAYNVNTNKVFLLGFSQGSILSYSLAFHFPKKINYVAALSGYINQELLPKEIDKQNVAHLDFFVSHGSVDQVIPVDWARNTKPFLDKLNIHNVYTEYPVGHSVAPQNFWDLKIWLEQRIENNS